MGKELADKYPAARQSIRGSRQRSGIQLSQLCFEGPEDQLRLTEITQPAFLLRRSRRCGYWKHECRSRSYVAGHSLGEYSAHVASGTFSFADAVRTVRNRGKYMQEAVPVGVGTMAAILGMDLEKVTAVCADAAQGEVCEPANINSPEQVVISGNTAAVERAAKLADERGAKRAKLLPVSAPFHCSLMKPAQDRLEADLNENQNATAGLSGRLQRRGRSGNRRPTRPRHTLRQVTGSVKWEQCIRLLIAQGVETFIEVGPGKVLCGLMRQIDRSKTCLNVGDEASLLKTVEALTTAAA